MTQLKNILAIGAHPDDIELGCGASLAKFVECGVHVRALVLTEGQVGNRTGDSRVEETRAALSLLGVEDIYTEQYPDTKLGSCLNEIIKVIESHVNDIDPDRVYTMYENDRHQDHRATFEASIVACRSARQILCYETPSSWTNFEPQVFECVDGYHERKIAALALHKSQRDRPYTQPDAMRTSGQFRGQQIGVKVAEAFIGYRVVL